MLSRIHLALFALATLFILVPALAAAGAPDIVPYQGFLRDDEGQPLDGPVNLEIRFFDAESGGTELHSETFINVPVDAGVFSIMLGSTDSLPGSLWNESAVFLETVVNGAPLAPRRQLGSAPFALRAAVADVALSGGSGDDGDWTISGNDIHRVDGDVGIGTNDPDAKLHVDGGSGAGPFAVITGGGSVFANVGLQLRDLGTANGNSISVELAHSGDPGGVSQPVAWSTITSTNFGTDAEFGTDLVLETSSNNLGGVNENQLVLQRSGRVGIGIDSPLSELHVVGDTRSTTFRAAADLGENDTPAVGAVYRDNVVYAWGRINGAGIAEEGFGIESVQRLSTGRYRVNFARNLADAAIPTVSAFSANDIVVAQVTLVAADRCEVATNIWLPGNGDFAPSDYRFLIQVVGRP
jgi:hypothetical protein